MSRPLRIQFPGALYHVTSRGDHREDIFADDADRQRLLAVVARGLERFDAQMLAYCLMGNHYHFVLQTRRANLSALMRHINGVYTQAFNRRHGQAGHLFQGRFKAIVVDRDAYLLEVCRYVELNPVRAGLVTWAGEWRWSSCRAHLGCTTAPAWLGSDELLSHLIGRDIKTDAARARARGQYAEMLAQGRGVALWGNALKQQIYLGDDDFVSRMQGTVAPSARRNAAVPRPQRSSTRSLAEWLTRCATREEALRRGHVESGLSMTAMAAELGLTVARVSQLIARAEKASNVD